PVRLRERESLLVSGDGLVETAKMRVLESGRAQRVDLSLAHTDLAEEPQRGVRTVEGLLTPAELTEGTGHDPQRGGLTPPVTGAPPVSQRVLQVRQRLVGAAEQRVDPPQVVAQ